MADAGTVSEERVCRQLQACGFWPLIVVSRGGGEQKEGALKLTAKELRAFLGQGTKSNVSKPQLLQLAWQKLQALANEEERLMAEDEAHGRALAGARFVLDLSR